MSNIKLEYTEFAKKHTAPATLQVVATSPGSSRNRIIIDYIECGGDAAGSLQLVDGGNVAIDGYFFTWAAGGQIVVDVPLKGLGLNTGLKYTTALGGNHNVIIKYHVATAD
jgi:hypothetical protein